MSRRDWGKNRNHIGRVGLAVGQAEVLVEVTFRSAKEVYGRAEVDV